MAASLSYRPEQYEQPYYLGLFKIADVQGRGNIGGADAVKFFGRSKLPVEVLKNIWTVSDQPSTSSLDLKKFAVAVRLIQLTQNGQKGKGQNLESPPGVILKPVFFEGVSGVSVQMPPAPPPQQREGMPPPHPTPQQPNRAMPPPQQTNQAPTSTGSYAGSHAGSQPTSPRSSSQRTHQLPPPHPTPSSPSRAIVGMDPYTLSPQERQRYEGLFSSYAKDEADGSQFVYGSEAVPLFMKSGVDPNSLREIWNMVDRNPVDNRLDKLEFALAMHLIVCVSKKNLPMPQGGTLPNSLQALKAASGAETPPSIPSISAQPQQQPNQMIAPPGPSVGDGGPPPPVGSISGGMGGMNISDAFEGMSAMGSVAENSHMAPEPVLPSYVPDVSVAPTPAAVPEPPTPQPQQTYVLQPQSPKRTVAEPIPVPVAPSSVATYEVSDSHVEELSKLKAVLQQLQAENISLKAQLGSMTEEEKHVQQELGQTVTEITSLSTDLGFQRQEVLDAKNRLLEARAELKAQRDTKGVLTGLISEAKETAEAIEDARKTLEATTLDQSRAPPVQESANAFDMGYSNPVGGPPSSAEDPPIEMEGFVNEDSIRSVAGMPGGVTSFPNPQPSGDIVPPGNTPVEQQLLSISEPSGQEDYSNYAAPLTGDYIAETGEYSAPMPPQQEPSGYPAPAPMPPQQDAGGYPAPAPMPPHQQAGGYPAPAPMPPNQQAGGYPAPAPMPPHQQAGGYPAPTPMPPHQHAGGYPAPTPMPPHQQAGGYPAPTPMPPQQQSPVQHRQMAEAGHRRAESGFDGGFLMGGSAQSIPLDSPQKNNDNISVAARSMASTGDYGYDDKAFEIVEDMKKKAKKADGVARDADQIYRKLAAEADELRTDADRAEANARSLAAAPEDQQKKKGRFGGGSKKKKKAQKDEADQASKDAALIKSHFMAIQSQALEAQTVAAQTRSVADRLRDEAETAEMDMASAASKNQKQPPSGQPQAAANGYNTNVSTVPYYGSTGAAAPQQQQHVQGQAQQQYGMPYGGPQMMPPNVAGGYSNYMSGGMGGDAAYGQQQQQYQQQQAYGAPPQTSGYGYNDKAFETVEGMKKEVTKADGVARKFASEADELRTDADRAQNLLDWATARIGNEEQQKTAMMTNGL